MPKRPALLAAAVLSLTLLCGGPAAAQAPSPEALTVARELVVAMRTGEQFRTLLPRIMQQLKPAIAQGRPEVERDFDAIMPHMIEIVDAQSVTMVEVVAVLYARNFTPVEMRQVIAFYRSPVGRKLLEKMPTITQESMVAGQKFGAAIAAELRNRMMEELRKRGHDL